MGGTTLVIAFSPLREYIPGYTSTNIRRQMVDLNQLSDSLSTELANRERYLQNIRNIVQGRAIDTNNTNTIKSLPTQLELTIEKTPEDSLLREQVEAEERFNFLGSTTIEKQNIENLLFFQPVKGLITQSFNLDEDHFGVDIVSKENELIKNTLNGVVVFSSWTSQTGNVIAVQHENNLLSIYKHNSVLLKNQGETVEAGEAIAIIGNSGKWTSGPHLHFELWYNNRAVDPEQYILF
jgi:murein DD-endopeptidase MepM/ murein hydrolase activator NlpD